MPGRHTRPCLSKAWRGDEGTDSESASATMTPQLQRSRIRFAAETIACRRDSPRGTHSLTAPLRAIRSASAGSWRIELACPLPMTATVRPLLANAPS